ncbi:MAG: hypothetical protein FJZ47_16230 [Candidatus Tectomicrobia bacterium]|uniref:Uncharacterized protein n=1 Tax=Tectimicrobiota bacterium TaxID=2528274 RepID=A0A937W1U8_UNCTE|nr:hypothetical protein [Candidatus Tectomicrobia bacterium]
MTAIAHWQQRVIAHTAQWQQARLAQGVADADAWEPLAASFSADPHRTDDPEVNRLAQEVQASSQYHAPGCRRWNWPLCLAAGIALSARDSGGTRGEYGHASTAPGC